MGLLLFFMSDLIAQTDSCKIYGITSKYAEISFESEIHDFGNIRRGDTVKYNFKFNNTGTDALLIKDASSGCDCTIPKWSNEPIKPGDSSAISITFISDEEGGNQVKEITVTTNTKIPIKVLRLTGYVDYSEK